MDVEKWYDLLEKLITGMGVNANVQLLSFVFLAGSIFSMAIASVVWLGRALHTGKMSALDRISSLQTVAAKLMEEINRLDTQYDELSALFMHQKALIKKQDVDIEEIKRKLLESYQKLMAFVSAYADFLFRLFWYAKFGLKNKYLLLKIMGRSKSLYYLYNAFKTGIENNPDIKKELSIEFDTLDIKIIHRFINKNLYWRIRNHTFNRQIVKAVMPLKQSEQ